MTELATTTTATPLPDIPANPLHLDLPDTLTEPEWATIARRLFTLAEAAPWWIGDLITHAEHHYANDGTDTAAMARIFTTIADITNMDPGEIADAATVARTIPPARRRRNLSWQHHRRASAAHQPTLIDQLLDTAETEGWTVEELDRTRRAWQTLDTTSEETEPTEARITITITAPLDPATEPSMMAAVYVAADQLRAAIDGAVVKTTAKSR